MSVGRAGGPFNRPWLAYQIADDGFSIRGHNYWDAVDFVIDPTGNQVTIMHAADGQKVMRFIKSVMNPN